MSANAVASSSTLPPPVLPSKKKKKKHAQPAPDSGSHEPSAKSHKKSKSSKQEKNSSFEHRHSRIRLSVPPKYASDWLVGVREVLDGMLMRYVPQLGGVLIAHWEHEFADETVKIVNECPFGVSEVLFRSIVWAPRIGQKLSGTHSLSSPSHISLLVNRTFNVSIPLQHIPLDIFAFEATHEADSDASSEEEDDGLGLPNEVEEVGRWRNTQKGKLLGEDGSSVKFTVIGMQVNNQMLSLTGSLLKDPHNPPPPPESRAATSAAHVSPSPSPSPEPTFTRPAKQSRPNKDRQQHPNGHAAAPGPNSETRVEPYAPDLQPHPEALSHPVVADEFMSAHELKKKRKEEQRALKEEKKRRKEARQLEAVEIGAGERMVDVQGTQDGAGIEEAGAGAVDGVNGEGQKKRKGEAGEGKEGKKKRKKDA